MRSLQIDSVLETCLYVEDLAAAEHFYSKVLGLERHSREAGKFAFFRVGAGMLLIFHPAASRSGSHELPNHGGSGVLHLAFAVAEASLDAWRKHLQAHGVVIEQDFVWPHGRRSLYFRDPAGHSLELAPAHLWNA